MVIPYALHNGYIRRRSMVEALRIAPEVVSAPATRSQAHEACTVDQTALHLLALPAIEILAGRARIEALFNRTLRRMEYLARQLAQTPTESQGVSPAQRAASQPRPFSTDDLLPSTYRFVEALDRPPMLPPPPPFETAFAPYAPMFHTVFYRRYPYARLDDAKQNALLHLWKHWKTDMTLLEQSAAYVVQAAVWGASPHRKIEREKRIRAHELPMPRNERYIDIRVADQSRDPGWVRRIDLSVDVQSAITAVRQTLQAQSDAEPMLAILEDILCGRTLKAGRQRSTLSFRGYKQARMGIIDQLRQLLADYAAPESACPAQPSGQSR